MGSYHGGEICDLVGLFKINKSKTSTTLRNIDLYRDDGLDKTIEWHPSRNVKKRYNKNIEKCWI